MKLIEVKRKTTYENRYHKKMGRLKSKVIRVRLTFLGIPIKTLHKYRETYYGEIKDVEDCILSR